PFRGSRNTPSFDGKPLSLERYFEDVQDVAEDIEQSSDDELITDALKYLETETTIFWKTKNAPGITFAAFKNEIRKSYDGQHLYTWDNLMALVKEQRSPQTREEFGEYQRDFGKVAEYLKKEGKISSREMDRYFLQGLNGDFCFRILTRLQVVKPDQPSDVPYPSDDVKKAA
ncbi:hypothetical protein C8R45DRAFT_757753, partial [Mycena sanguinolenta]